MSLSDLVKELIDATLYLRDPSPGGIGHAEQRYKAARVALDRYERQLLANFQGHASPASKEPT